MALLSSPAEMSSDKNFPALTMGVILPHTKIFGGVKRFFELGKVFIRHGHEFVVFTPEGEPPDWYPGNCKVEKLSTLPGYRLDALFFTQVEFLTDVISAQAKLKIIYHIGPRVILHKVLKHREVIVFANSSTIFDLDKRKYGIQPEKAFGGIDVPEVNNVSRVESDPIHIMAYGRLSRKGKGTALVVKACEKLYDMGYHIKLLLFDSPIDQVSRQKINNFQCKVPFEFIVDHPVQDNHSLFRRADIFVAAERKGGWSNTAAEALACGVALVGTRTGTRDFLLHKQTGLLVWRHPYFIRKALQKLIDDPALRQRLAHNGREKIKQFNWENLSRFIESYVTSKIHSNVLPE